MAHVTDGTIQQTKLTKNSMQMKAIKNFIRVVENKYLTIQYTVEIILLKTIKKIMVKTVSKHLFTMYSY